MPPDSGADPKMKRAAWQGDHSQNQNNNETQHIETFGRWQSIGCAADRVARKLAAQYGMPVSTAARVVELAGIGGGS